MINSYVQKLIENLPDDLKNRTKPLKLDIVLDGGAFNGNYLVGALYFLKEMEKRKYIIIDRISGSSIGSFVGILYFIDKLENSGYVYGEILHDIVYRLLKNIQINVENGFIYELTEDGDVGEKVGYLKDGEPFFYADEK